MATVCSSPFCTNSRAFPPDSVYFDRNASSPRAVKIDCHVQPAMTRYGEDGARTDMEGLRALPDVKYRRCLVDGELVGYGEVPQALGVLDKLGLAAHVGPGGAVRL